MKNFTIKVENNLKPIAFSIEKYSIFKTGPKKR